jgi:MarR family transcriptional regulator, temperature-dependent positive regulator of motility
MVKSDLDEIKQMLHSLVTSTSSPNSSFTNLTASDLRDLELRLRRIRNRNFPVGYFSDFAWDILLDLDKASREGRRFVVSDAGSEAGIPLTTTVRYIAKLERDGYIQRETDPNDRRRTFVSLTELGAQALDATFDQTVSSQPILQ